MPVAKGSHASQPIAPEDFHRHQMKAFRGWGYDYANASLKLLISAIGPKPLLDHLERFKKSTPRPEESAAAGQFIDLIHQAYNAAVSVDTAEFLDSLQKLAPFNQRNAAGELEFKVRHDFPFTRPQYEPEQFLLLISQLLRLDTLPGWSFDIDETYVHQGEERRRESSRNAFQMFQPVQLNWIKPADYAGLNLQKLVDLLHADQEAQMKWNEADTGLTTVKVRRQISIADVENFKRLTISLQGTLSRSSTYSLGDTVTLPAINRKTGQKIVLTLAAKEALVWSGTSFVIRIKGRDGQWPTHSNGSVFPTGDEAVKQSAMLINFAVTGVDPAP